MASHGYITKACLNPTPLGAGHTKKMDRRQIEWVGRDIETDSQVRIHRKQAVPTNISGEMIRNKLSF